LDLLRIRNSHDARFEGNSRVSEGLDKRLFNNDFAGTWGLFRRAGLSPIRNNMGAGSAVNPAVIRIDNKQGYIKKVKQVYVAYGTSDVTKIVLKIVADHKQMSHTCTKFSHNYDKSSYVFEGSLPPQLTLLFA
jgi:hypothetical protein